MSAKIVFFGVVIKRPKTVFDNPKKVNITHFWNIMCLFLASFRGLLFPGTKKHLLYPGIRETLFVVCY